MTQEWETKHIEALARVETKLEAIDDRLAKLEVSISRYTAIESRLGLLECQQKGILDKLSEKSKWTSGIIATLIIGIVMLGVTEFYKDKVINAKLEASPQQQDRLNYLESELKLYKNKAP